MFEEYWNS